MPYSPENFKRYSAATQEHIDFIAAHPDTKSKTREEVEELLLEGYWAWELCAWIGRSHHGDDDWEEVYGATVDGVPVAYTMWRARNALREVASAREEN